MSSILYDIRCSIYILLCNYISIDDLYKANHRALTHLRRYFSSRMKSVYHHFAKYFESHVRLAHTGLRTSTTSQTNSACFMLGFPFGILSSFFFGYDVDVVLFSLFSFPFYRIIVFPLCVHLTSSFSQNAQAHSIIATLKMLLSSRLSVALLVTVCS